MHIRLHPPIVLAVFVSLLSPLYAQTWDTLRDAAAGVNKGTAEKAQPMYVGMALYKECIDDWFCSKTAKEEFNMFVAENDCKFYSTEPSRGVYDFSKCDRILEFAQDAGAAFRGHTLSWRDSDSSPWTNNLDAAALQDTLVNHIKAIVGHYKGKVYAWDVVNEAIHQDSTQANITMDPRWVWTKIGNDRSDYLDIAFAAAHEADPHAKLFYNDYNIEFMPPRNSHGLAVYQWIKNAKERNVPVHGVGFQSHFWITWSPTRKEISDLMDLYNAIDVEVHITELDIKCPKDEVSGRTCDTTLQGEIARRVMDVCLAKPNCKTYIVWGITDAYSWIGPENKPLPFTDRWIKKPFYTQMLDSLRLSNPEYVAWKAAQPTTTTTTTTRRAGLTSSPTPTEVVQSGTGAGSGASWKPGGEWAILFTLVVTILVLIMQS